MLKDSFVDVPPEYFDDKFTSNHVEVGGVDLHYTDWSPENEKTVVLVHGLNVQTHTWDPIAEDLASDYRVICPDLRGHGDSAWAPDYWMASFLADLDGIVDHLELGEFSLVGHSLGARIVLAYAGSRADRVTRAVLSDTGPELPRSASKFTQSVLANSADIKGFRDEEEAKDHFRAGNPEWREVFIRLHARYQLRRNWADKLVFKADPQLFWLTGSAGRKDTPYVWEMTAQVKAPTLALWAERSVFFDEELADRMLSTLPNGELQRVADSGHFIPRERPEALVESVRTFLDA